MKALVIRPDAVSIETIDLPEDDTASYKAIKAIIGNWVCSAFRVDTEFGIVYGYCDDEFLLNGRKDWCCMVGETLRKDAPYPIGGPVVICGSTRGGENRGLVPEELSHFTLSTVRVQANVSIFGRAVPKLPLLQWEG